MRVSNDDAKRNTPRLSLDDPGVFPDKERPVTSRTRDQTPEEAHPQMSPSRVPKEPPGNQPSEPSLTHPQANGIKPEPGPGPELLDDTDKPEVIALDLSMEHDAHMFDTALFAAGYEVRHNTLSKRTEWRVPITLSVDYKVTAASEWQPWTDRSAATARHALAEIRHGLPLRNNSGPIDDIVGTFRLKALQMEDAVSLLAAQNPVHPLVEWLENDVPKWDGMERLAYLMEDTFTVKNTRRHSGRRGRRKLDARTVGLGLHPARHHPALL